MKIHFIRKNEYGTWYITGYEDTNITFAFTTYEEALKWANEEGIVITRER